MKINAKFPIGTHYEYPFGGTIVRPEWYPSGEADWRRDLREIRKTGFNFIRVRIGFDHKIEELVKLLDIASEENLKVMLGFMTFYAPDWFVEKYPDSKAVDINGDKIAEGVNDHSWPRLCIDYPLYRRMRNELIEECVKRFKDHNALFAWDLENEPGIPGQFSCYCSHTLAKFREYLKKKYSRIDLLNKKWKGDFKSFESVTPPTKVPSEPECIPWMEWREFMIQNLNSFFEEGVALIKRYDKDNKVTINVTELWDMSRRCHDWWWAGDKLDFLSASIYPSGQSSQEMVGSRFKIDLLKSLGKGKEVWILECHAGPNHANPFFCGQDIYNQMFEFLAYGVKGVVYYRWEPLKNKNEAGHTAMIEPDNYQTEVRIRAEEMIEDLKDVDEILLNGITPAAKVAIYLPREEFLSSLDISQTQNSSYGFYALFDDLDISVEFITEPFSKAKVSDELIIVPAISSLSLKDLQAIGKFLQGGGNVIFEPSFNNIESCKKNLSWLNLQPDDIYSVKSCFPIGWELRDKEKKFRGFAYYKRADLNAGKENIIAEFSDKKAAIFALSYGKGKILLPCFPLGASYLTFHHWGIRRLVKEWLPLSIKPVLEVAVPKDVIPLIKARILQTKNDRLLFVTSNAKREVEFKVRVDGKEIQDKITPFGANKYKL